MRSIHLTLAAGLLVAASCAGSSGTADAPDAVPHQATTPQATTPNEATTPTVPNTTPATAAPSTLAPTPSTSAPVPSGPVVITSPDGDLTLTVDAADAARVGPSIRILDPSEWPAEFAGSQTLPGVTLYELEPDGATFEQPISVTRRLSAANFEGFGDLDVPLVTLITQNDDGAYELLGDLTILRIGPDIWVSGTTSHFSPLATISERSSMSLRRADLEQLPTDRGIDLANIPGVTLRGDVGPHSYTATFEPRTVPTTSLAFDAALTYGNLVRTVPDVTDLLFKRLGTRYLPFSGLENVAGAEGFDAVAHLQDLQIDMEGTTTGRLLDHNAQATFDVTMGTMLFHGSMTAPPIDTLLDARLGYIDTLTALDSSADSWSIMIEVFHVAYGDYPSNLGIDVMQLPPTPPGISIYPTVFESNPTGGPPRIVSIGEFAGTTDGAQGATAGIECYCPYHVGLLVTDGPLSESAIAQPGSDPQIQQLFDDPTAPPLVGFVDPESDQLLDLTVTKAEGVLYGGPIAGVVVGAP